MTTHESDAAHPRRAVRGADDHPEIVALLQELAHDLEVEPDPAFRQATRQRLVAMAAVRTPEPAPPSRLHRLLAARAVDAPAGSWRGRATAGLAAAALTVTSLAAVVALSTGSQPGDLLYGVKRGTEQTQLALAGDSRGQVLLDLARTRLAELRDLAGSDDAARVSATLATMDEQTTEGAAWLTTRALATTGADPLDRLSGWAAEQSAQLTAARGGLPAPADADVDNSLGLLADITARVADLRTVIGCPTGPAPGGADQLGPLPAGCLPGPGVLPQAPGGGSGEPPAPLPPGPVPEPGVTPAPGTPAAQPPAPAGPPGQPQQPSPAAPSQAPRPPATPAPSPPGGLLDPLSPVLPPAGPPSSPSATPTPALTVPLPLDLCLHVPLLLQAGRC